MFDPLRKASLATFVTLTLALPAQTTTPERPWIHHYDQTLTMKMKLATKIPGGGTHIETTLDQALNYVKQMDALTLGIPKILYLVGWQYDGHDSKYPAFFEVNAALKRPQDATALDSLKWFMQAAKQYHTTISVHINLRDAYPSSPLWDFYVKHDLIQRGADGQLAKGSIWGGEVSYRVCFTKEWDEGYTQQRIDKLLKLLPLEEAGTVQIDAYYPTPCVGQHVSLEQEQEAQRKVYRYFRDRNIDVTGEKQGSEQGHWPSLVGLEPMAFWLAETPKEYLQYPASLLTGGTAAKGGKDHEEVDLPGKLFGSSFMAEGLFNGKSFLRFKHEFCTLTLPWYFLNQHKRLTVDAKSDSGTATFDDDVQTRVDATGHIIITQNNRTLRDGDDILMPAGWIAGRTLVAYSADGYKEKSWDLPPEWKSVSKIKVLEITASGLQSLPAIVPANGKVVLHLAPDQALLLSPSE